MHPAHCAELRAAAAQQTAQSIAALQEADAAQRRGTFLRQAKQLHHLVSTEARAGILRPPLRAAQGAAPAAQGRSLEEHIRSCHRRHVRHYSYGALRCAC